MTAQRCKHASDAIGRSEPGKGAPRRCALGLFEVVHTLTECAKCKQRDPKAPAQPDPPPPVPLPCRHRSTEPVASDVCATCSGSVSLKVFTCAVFTTCTIAKRVKNRGCCDGCDRREEPTT